MASATIMRAGSPSSRHAFERRTEEVKFTKAEMNNLVMDWLVSRGYKNAAETFSQEANMAVPQDYTIEQRVEIRNAIHSGDALGAIHMVNELDPYLLETNPKLHFAMLRLHLIELIRTGQSKKPEDIMPAVQFSSKNLSPLTTKYPEFIEDLNLAMALILYPADKRPAKVSALLKPSLRQSVAEEVNKTIRGLMGGRDVELIRMLLRARAWGEQQARTAGKELPTDLGIGLDPPSHTNGSSWNGTQAQNGDSMNGGAEAMDQ